MVWKPSDTILSDGSKGYSMVIEMAVTINRVVGQQSAWSPFQKESHSVKMKSPLLVVKSLVLAYCDHTALLKVDTMHLGSAWR